VGGRQHHNHKDQYESDSHQHVFCALLWFRCEVVQNLNEGPAITGLRFRAPGRETQSRKALLLKKNVVAVNAVQAIIPAE
jgi:hypothetical protein